jgi:eukaryotic-like serine/threonine-protein kinase
MTIFRPKRPQPFPPTLLPSEEPTLNVVNITEASDGDHAVAATSSSWSCEATLHTADVICSYTPGGDSQIVDIEIHETSFAPAEKAQSQPSAEFESLSPQVRCLESKDLAISSIPSTMGQAHHYTDEDHQRFCDEGVIARGGMGAIHKVFDRRLLRYEAKKRLEPALQGDLTYVARFIEEAQITGQLDHPNIVPVYNLKTRAQQEHLEFSMKLVRGKTLGRMLLDWGEQRLYGLQLQQLIQIVIRVCDAVSFAHSRGVVHCDLKPDNIMIGKHGQVYLMDWGLAVVMEGGRPSQQSQRLSPLPIKTGTDLDPSTGNSARIRGTPAYMAPEQAWGIQTEIDERTDVYGIGGILYRILTLRAPHQAGSIVQAVKNSRYRPVPHPTELIMDTQLPPELCRMAMKSLQTEKQRRYQSIALLRDDLESFLTGGGWLETIAYQPGEIILEEGENGTEAFIIESGNCEAYKMVNGKRISLRVMGPGEVFGETAVFSSHPRTASVVAVDEVTLRVVTRESLEKELSLNRWVGAFMRVLAERFRERDQQVIDQQKQQSSE